LIQNISQQYHNIKLTDFNTIFQKIDTFQPACLHSSPKGIAFLHILLQILHFLIFNLGKNFGNRIFNLNFADATPLGVTKCTLNLII